MRTCIRNRSVESLCNTHGGHFDNSRARQCDFVKMTPQGYSVAQFDLLTRALADYARTENFEPKTIELPRGQIKYRVTVKGAGAAHSLYHALTNEIVDGGIELREYAPYFNGNTIVTPKKTYTANADDAMRLYGHPFHAAKVLEAQLAADASAFDEKINRNATERIISELKERALGKGKVIAHRPASAFGKAYDETASYIVTAELEKIGAPLSPIGSHTLTDAEQKELDEINAEMERQERAEQERQARLIPVTTKTGAQYFVKVGELESTDYKSGELCVYDENGEHVFETRGKYKGYYKNVEKKKLTWKYEDLHPEYVR